MCARLVEHPAPPQGSLARQRQVGSPGAWAQWLTQAMRTLKPGASHQARRPVAPLHLPEAPLPAQRRVGSLRAWAQLHTQAWLAQAPIWPSPLKPPALHPAPLRRLGCSLKAPRARSHTHTRLSSRVDRTRGLARSHEAPLAQDGSISCPGTWRGGASSCHPTSPLPSGILCTSM